MKRLLAVALLATSCQSAKVLHERDGVYTLTYPTGLYGASLYEGNFERAAEEICPKGYHVHEKTFAPTTLTDYRDLCVGDEFYWVVECKP